MGVILLDTSILIDHLRGYPPASEALEDAARRRHRLAASVLTRFEIFAGMRAHEETITRRLLEVIDWIPVDEALADDAGHLANHYLKSHPGVDPVDYVIAATADRVDALLWTRNLKHFPMFPGLTAPY